METEQPEAAKEPKMIARLRRFFLAYAIMAVHLGGPAVLGGIGWMVVHSNDLLWGMGLFAGGLYNLVVAWVMVMTRRKLAAREPDAPRQARVSLVAAVPGALVFAMGGVFLTLTGYTALGKTPFALVPLILGAAAILVSLGIVRLLVDMLRSDELDLLLWGEIEPDVDAVLFDFESDEGSVSAAAHEQVEASRGL